MMDKERWLLLFILISLNGCQNDTILDSTMVCDDGRKISIGEGCDPKCVPAGCSNQLCVLEEETKNIVTTCEYNEEYKCFVYSKCGYFDGECKWEETSEYLECLEEVR